LSTGAALGAFTAGGSTFILFTGCDFSGPGPGVTAGATVAGFFLTFVCTGICDVDAAFTFTFTVAVGFFEKTVLAAPQRFELVVAQEANFFGSALYLTGRCCLE
jgi:hypothetical protein